MGIVRESLQNIRELAASGHLNAIVRGQAWKGGQ